MTVAGPSTPSAATQASSRAVAALVIGIVSVITCCGAVAGPVAWYLGNEELKAIRQGASPAAGEMAAKVGMILGILGSIVLIMVLLWIFLMGGLATLSALMNH